MIFAKIGVVVLSIALAIFIFAGYGKVSKPEQVLSDSVEKTVKYVVGEDLIDCVEGSVKTGSVEASLNSEIQLSESDFSFPITSPTFKMYFSENGTALDGSLGFGSKKDVLGISLFSNSGRFIADISVPPSDGLTYGCSLEQLRGIDDEVLSSLTNGKITSEMLSDIASMLSDGRKNLDKYVQKYLEIIKNSILSNIEIKAEKKLARTEMALTISSDNIENAICAVYAEFEADTELRALIEEKHPALVEYLYGKADAIKEKFNAIREKYLPDGTIIEADIVIRAGMITQIDVKGYLSDGTCYSFGYNVESKIDIMVYAGKDDEIKNAHYHIVHDGNDFTESIISVSGEIIQTIHYEKDSKEFTITGKYLNANGRCGLEDGVLTIEIKDAEFMGKEIPVKSFTITKTDIVPTAPESYNDLTSLNEEKLKADKVKLAGEILLAMLFSKNQ